MGGRAGGGSVTTCAPCSPALLRVQGMYITAKLNTSLRTVMLCQASCDGALHWEARAPETLGEDLEYLTSEVANTRKRMLSYQAQSARALSWNLHRRRFTRVRARRFVGGVPLNTVFFVREGRAWPAGLLGVFGSPNRSPKVTAVCLYL